MQPETPKKVEVQPETPKKVEVQPETPKKVEVQPETPKKFEVQPETPKKVEVQPESPKKVEVQPETPKKVEVQPETPKKVEVQPESPKKVEVQPESPKKVDVQPDTLKKDSEIKISPYENPSFDDMNSIEVKNEQDKSFIDNQTKSSMSLTEESNHLDESILDKVFGNEMMLNSDSKNQNELNSSTNDFYSGMNNLINEKNPENQFETIEDKPKGGSDSESQDNIPANRSETMIYQGDGIEIDQNDQNEFPPIPNPNPEFPIFAEDNFGELKKISMRNQELNEAEKNDNNSNNINEQDQNMGDDVSKPSINEFQNDLIEGLIDDELDHPSEIAHFEANEDLPQNNLKENINHNDGLELIPAHAETSNRIMEQDHKPNNSDDDIKVTLEKSSYLSNFGNGNPDNDLPEAGTIFVPQAITGEKIENTNVDEKPNPSNENSSNPKNFVGGLIDNDDNDDKPKSISENKSDPKNIVGGLIDNDDNDDKPKSISENKSDPKNIAGGLIDNDDNNNETAELANQPVTENGEAEPNPGEKLSLVSLQSQLNDLF